MLTEIYAKMSYFEIEFGKRGLDIEMKGKALFWIVAISFLSGVTVGVYLEAKKDVLKKRFRKN